MRIQSAKAMQTADLQEAGRLGRQEFQRSVLWQGPLRLPDFSSYLTPSHQPNVDSEDPDPDPDLSPETTVELEPAQAGRRGVSKMCENSFCKLKQYRRERQKALARYQGWSLSTFG